MNTPNPANENNPQQAKSYTRRSPNLRLAQRRQISRMLVTGHTQSEIAEIMGLSESTVSREVAQLKSGYRAQVDSNLKELQANELAAVDEVIQAAWAIHHKGNGDSAEGINTVLKAMKQRQTIMGLDSPDFHRLLWKVEHMKKKIMQALLDTIHDPALLERVGQRLQEISIEDKSEEPYEATNYELSSPPTPEPVLNKLSSPPTVTTGARRRATPRK